MKVMCIDDKGFGKKVPCPTFGEVVTVSDTDCPFHKPGYEFVEYGKNNWYSQDRFVPLSDIDETELVSEEFKEKYFIPAT